MNEPSSRPSSRPFRTPRVLGIAAGHAVHDTFTAFLPPLLPTFIQTLALTRAEAGVLAVFLQLPSLLQPWIGHQADRLRLRRLVILAPTVSAVAMCLLGWAPGFVGIAVLLSVAGLSSAGLHAVAPAVAGKLAGRSLGRAMGFWMVGGELGRTLGPLLLVSALPFLGLRGLPWLIGLGVAASLLLLWTLHGVRAELSPDPGRRPWREALRRMRPVLLPVAGLAATRIFLAVSVTTYLPTFLTEGGSRLWTAGASLSLLEAAGVLGAISGGWLSDRWGRRRVLALAQLTAPPLLVLFLLTEGWARIPALLGLGFTLLSMGPVLMATVQESLPENRALANGIYAAVAFGLRAVATVAVGLAGDLFGLHAAFVGSGVLMLVGLPLLRALPGRRH